MNDRHSSFDCTSADFEKAALQRFRSLVPFVPQDCQVFREPWEATTVVCLDFANCPDLLEATSQKSDLLIQSARKLGLGNAVIFRISNRLMGWRR